VPGVVAGLSHSIEYSRTLSIEVSPEHGLTSPRPMALDRVLLSTQAVTKLLPTRDTRRYQVTSLQGGANVVNVTQDGQLSSGTESGSAVVTLGPSKAPFRHLIVQVCL